MPERAPARSIYILILLFLINLMNFFDRTIPAVVLEPIRKEFSLDDTALGILGASFTLIYAVAGVPLGYLADRFRRTYILAAGLTAWSLLTAASGLAWSFMSFFWIRLLVGVGEASCAPAANSLIGDLFPSEKRARALGVFMLGLPLGLLLAFSIVGVLAQNYGWRVPFYLAAIPGFVVAAMMLFAAEPVRGSQETYAIDATTALDRPMRRILAIPTVWWIIASGATVNFAAYAMSTFLPTMLIRYHGLSIGRAGLIAAIVLGATGLIGLTAGGWLADYLHKKFLRGRLLLASCSMLVATPLLYFGLAQPAGAADAATILLSLGWLLYFSYYCSVYSALQDVVEPRLRATAMAVYFFFQYVLGAGFGTVVTGALSDMYARQAMTAAQIRRDPVGDISRSSRRDRALAGHRPRRPMMQCMIAGTDVTATMRKWRRDRMTLPFPGGRRWQNGFVLSRVERRASARWKAKPSPFILVTSSSARSQAARG